MRPALGIEETTEAATPAKKRAAKKSNKVSEKGDAALKHDPNIGVGGLANLMQAKADREAAENVPAKRTRRSRAEMEAAGAQPRAASGEKSIAAMRREAERLLARADAAEAREILSTARNHVKELEREGKELAKAVAANTKALEKAKSILARLEGPGE